MMKVKMYFNVILFGLFFHKVFASYSDLFKKDLYKSVLNSSLCRQHLNKMNTLSFLDAGFRIPQSITLGSQGSLGNYDQCLNIKQVLPETVIEGKYCMIDVAFDNEFVDDILKNLGILRNTSNIATENTISSDEALSVGLSLKKFVASADEIRESVLAQNVEKHSVRLALCIPKTCSVKDVAIFFNMDSIDYTEKYCRLPNDKVFATEYYIGIVIFLIIGLITSASTMYDLYVTFALKKEQPSNLLKCCSIYTNTYRLFSFRDTPNTITCLDGIRSLSIIWIIGGHSLLNNCVATIINPLTAVKWIHSPNALWFTLNQLSVDTFFMLSGLLLVHNAVTKFTQNNLLKKLHLFYLYRLLRLFPLLAAIILIQISIFHHLQDGPNWHLVTKLTEDCKQNWWLTFLHVQNFLSQGMCLPQAWYLAVDTQLHIISPLVLYWVLGSRRSASAALTAGMIVSLVAAFLYSFLSDFHTFSLIDIVTDELREFHKYINTLPRAPAFVVGMSFGYLIHVLRNKKLKIHTGNAACYWLLSIVMLCSIIYLTCLPINISPVWYKIFNAILRPLWGLSLGWIILACHQGYGAICPNCGASWCREDGMCDNCPVNWFLSLTLWKFIGRISYALYMFHMSVQWLINGSRRTPIMFTATEFVYYFIIDFVITTLVSVIMFVIVDAPFSTLMKELFTSAFPSSKKEKEHFKSIEPLQSFNLE